MNKTSPASDLEKLKMDSHAAVPTNIKVDPGRLYPELDNEMFHRAVPTLEPSFVIEKDARSELAPGYKVIYSTGMPPRP